MINNGKLIVIEGTDGSGKQTQTNILYERLKKERNVKQISFPNYDSPACEPVKMYLSGKFGENATKINPYPVSVMYAIDRYASYKTDWGKWYEDGEIIITDRYTTSNMVHQASKIENSDEKNSYLSWLKDLEYDKMELPRPDIVIFLNMSTDFTMLLMKDRENKITGKKRKDIHELDKWYLEKSYKNACEIARLENWYEIKCEKNGKIRTIEDISEEIFNIVNEII